VVARLRSGARGGHAGASAGGQRRWMR
jgi:hypothetical protein